MAQKTPYFDPFMSPRQQMMKLRSDVVETQLENNALHARDIQAAKEEKAEQKAKRKGLFRRKAK